LSEKIDFF